MPYSAVSKITLDQSGKITLLEENSGSPRLVAGGVLLMTRLGTLLAARWDARGRKLRLPVMLAPVGSLESFNPGGAATAGRGATEFGVPIIVSSVTRPGLEETAKAVSGPKIFQLYVRGDDAWVDDYVRRARDSGFGSFFKLPPQAPADYAQFDSICSRGTITRIFTALDCCGNGSWKPAPAPRRCQRRCCCKSGCPMDCPKVSAPRMRQYCRKYCDRYRPGRRRWAGCRAPIPEPARVTHRGVRCAPSGGE
jgi:hypothetical protein